MSGIPDAPWVGLCKEDYEDKMRGRRKRELVCYCEECGVSLYEDDEIHEMNDEVLCDECFWKEIDKECEEDEECNERDCN